MLQKLFGFNPQKHSLKTEIVAGITTFLTMAYILAVNPSIFSALAEQGMPTDSVFLTSVLMPLTYSISHGIMIGTISYVIINACTGKMNRSNAVLWILAILFVLRYIFL